MSDSIVIESTAHGFANFEAWYKAQRNSEWSTFRYVVHDRVLDYLMCGWHIANPDLGPPHGDWSVLMQWLCSCKMVEPRR